MFISLLFIKAQHFSQIKKIRKKNENFHFNDFLQLSYFNKLLININKLLIKKY